MIWFPYFILPFVISPPTFLYQRHITCPVTLISRSVPVETLVMMRLRRLFGFSLILFIVKVDGVQIGAKPPLLVCHVPLELKIFADSSYQASSADLKSCTLITLSSVNVLFLSSSNASLASVMVSEKRSLQLLKQQTPEAAFSFSLRSTNTFPATRHLRTIFNGATSVALLIEFLKVNKLTSFDIAWDLIQSTPDYVPKLKSLKAALAKEGFNLTTTIGVEVNQTDAFHLSKIAAIVDHIFLVPSYNRHYSGALYPLADKKLEQAFDTLELNEGVFLKLYSTLNLSWTKIVVGLSLQTLVWKLIGGTTVVGTQFNQNQAVLHLQNYYESCKTVNSTWRLRQQPNPFYKLAVASTNDQWMIHVDTSTLGKRVDLLRQYGFGGVALYDYYQDDFAGVCNANGKVYPLIHQAGLSLFNNSNTTPFPEIDPNGGLCIPFLGLTSQCKGIFNFGTAKLNTSSSIGSTSSTTSSSVTVTKTTAPVENISTTTHTSLKYSSENNVTTPLSSSSTTVTTASSISRGARMSDAENLVRTRRSSVSSEGTEPSFPNANPPEFATATEINLDFPSTYSSDIKLPVAESLVTTSVSLNAATEAFPTKVELWRDDQTQLSGVPGTSALNQTEDSNITTSFDQDIQQPTSPNTVMETAPTTSLPLKKSKTVAVKQTLTTSETETTTDIVISPTIPSVAVEVATSIQLETEPTSTSDFTGIKLIDEITTVSSKSASLHGAFTEITSPASKEGDAHKFTGDKSTNKVASDFTSPLTENVTVSGTEQPSLILEVNENTPASAETETDSISISRPSALDNQQPSSPNSGSVDDLMEQTTSKLSSSSSDTRQDWTSPIPLSAAFEISPSDIKMESLNAELALTTKQPPTDDDDAFSTETTPTGYQGTISAVPPSASSSEQFTMSGIPPVAAEISTESDPVSDGFPSTMESIPSVTNLASTDQDIVELSTEHFGLVASSMAPIDETQFPTDFHLSTPNIPTGEDVSSTDDDPLSITAIDSADTYFSTEHEDTISTVSSQRSSNEHFTNDEFSTTTEEISDTESSIAFGGLSSTTGIPSIKELSTESATESASEREDYFSSSSAVSTNTIQPVEPSEDNFYSESSLPHSYSSPYYLIATDIPTEIHDLSTISSQYSSSDQVSIGESTEGSLSSDLFSPTFELTIPVNQLSSSTFFDPNILDSSTQEQLLDSSSPNSPTFIEETDISPSIPSSPIPLDVSTEDTQLLGNENDFSTTNFSWEKSQSEITSPQPERSTIQQSVEETNPTDSALSFYSIDISTEYQDEVSSLPPQGSSNQQMENTQSSALSSEFAETSPEGVTFEPTLRPTLVDSASTFIIPDIDEMESSTENLSTSTSENLAGSSEELESQETNLSTPVLDIIVDVSTIDPQLVDSEIYFTTSAAPVDSDKEETVSSSLTFVTDENAGDDIAPLIDTLNPNENEFASSGEEDLFSSVEADFSSTSSYVSREQTASPSQSNSLRTTDSPVTTSFPTGLHSTSTTLEALTSSTNSPHFSEYEMGSGDESNDVSTLAPIFENEGSGEDSTSTLEENITPGFLNVTDKPETISETDSTTRPLTSSPAENVPEASTIQDMTTAFIIESTSDGAMTDSSFVQELEEDASTKMTTIISGTVSVNLSTESPFASTSPSINDIPSTEVPFGNTILPTHSTESVESLVPTFSSSSTLLSSQSFIAEVVTGSPMPSPDYNNNNTMTSSTAAWSETSSESSSVTSSTSTDSTSSLPTSTTNVATSNTSPDSISTKEWIDVSTVTTQVPSNYPSESITVSSSKLTALPSTSSSTTSHSTSSFSSSMAPTSTTGKSSSTTSSFRTTKFSTPYSEIPTTTTEIPLVGLWNMLISKLNLTNRFPSAEYSFISNSLWSNSTSSSLISSEEFENIKEIPSSFTSNTVPAGNLIFETRPFWLVNRPNTEASTTLSTTRSPPKETNRTPLPVSRTTTNIYGTSTSTPIADLFETRPFWLQGSTSGKPTKLTLSSTPNIRTSRESSSTLTSSTKALHTSAFELRPSRTTETPPSSTASLISAQQLSTSLNPNVIRGPCTENCTAESAGNSSVVVVAKDVANNVVVHLNVNGYMGDKNLNSSFNFDKWLEDLNRFLSSPSSSKPQTGDEIKPSPICQVAGNSILLKSLFCSNESLSTAEKIRFPNLMNLTRRLAPAIIANLTTAMNLTEVAPDNGIELLSHRPNIINETSTESIVSMSTESSTKSSVVIQNSTSFFDSLNVSTTLVTSNLSDIPLPTVLNGSLESFMLNLTALLKDAQMNNLILAVNQLNHSIPEGFLENLIQSNNSEDGGLFNQSAAENDAITTHEPTSTFSATATAPVEYDIFQKNFWKTNRRNPVRKLQRVAGPGLGIIPSIRLPLRTTAKPVSSIFSSLAKPAAPRQ